jgi:hypothetical protein
MSNLIIMPEVEDIQLFLSAGSTRSSNDESNKIREDIITNMIYIHDEYLNHPIFGIHWTSIREKFIKTINSLCQDPFKEIKIKHMGGMSYNYDFLITFLGQLNEETNMRGIVEEVKLEFKHNNSSVSDLAQFLELYDKDCKNTYNICEMSYAEYYYDNYLDTYLQLENGITEQKPSKEQYLKNVYDIKYRHPFFKNMYETKNNKTKEKRTLASDSISSYLQLYSNTFNYEKITEKIKESQLNKYFLLWDCENFHIQKLNIQNIQIKEIKENSLHKLYFDVVVENFCYDIRIRINWGNNACVANPRWKFTFTNKSEI